MDRKPSSRRVSPWLCLLLACGLLSVHGCGGCKQNPQAKNPNQQQQNKPKPKPKPDFPPGRMQTLPNSISAPESRGKPGHWTSANLEVVSNNFNFLGEVGTDAVDLDHSTFQVSGSRPVALAKGQRKNVEITFFAPMETTRRRVRTALFPRDSGREVAGWLNPLNKMEPFQFYFFVLAREPDRYAFLRTLNSVQFKTDELTEDDTTTCLRILTPNIRTHTPLPTNPLTWTTIAYLVWDDMDPTNLSPEQEQALIDWLHWGGQLIVSAPGSLGLLRGSVLDPYLPESAGSDLELPKESLDPLNDRWTRGGVALEPVKAWTGEKLTAEPPWEVLVATPNGEPLVIDRRVGAGRIVVSAFRLSQRELADWSGFDGFFNACLLRRNGRVFSGQYQTGWVNGDGTLPLYDAVVHSKLRYFSRDTDPRLIVSDTYENEMPSGYAAPGFFPGSQWPGGMEPQRRSMVGVATWDDFSGVSNVARDALREAAGINVPDARFVLRILGIYLAVLVPLNWGLFRVMGRVEWAWAAAPVISIACALVVVRLAQLDIGFARAKTEIAVVETQPGYSRAHVTRYTALYTSLSTSYDMIFEDHSALSLPFSTEVELLPGQSRQEVQYRREDSAQLKGFEVSSNSTGMLRSEQMLDLGGPLVLTENPPGTYRVQNTSRLTIKGAGVLHGIQGNRAEQDAVGKPGGGRVAVGETAIELAWIGDLEPGESVRLEFSEPVGKAFWTAERNESKESASRATPGTLNVRNLLALADKGVLEGEIRLVGWIGDELPGLRIEPAASQFRQAAVLVARLREANLPPVAADVYNQ